MPRISVVVTAYNAARFLNSTLESVLWQSFADWELVVVDDGSSDETFEVASGYARQDSRVRAIKQGNTGVARARNAGYAATTSDSEFVIFLDHDDVWERDALEVLLDRLQEDSQASAAYGLAAYMGASGEPIRVGELEAEQKKRMAYANRYTVPWPIERPTTFEVVVNWSYITSPGQVLIRRSSLADEEPFDQAVAPADDWDLYLRLTLRGPIPLIDRVVLNYRWHEANVSKNTKLMDESFARVRRKFYRIRALSSGQRESVLQCYRMLQRHKYHQHRTATKQALLKGRLFHALPEGLTAIGFLFRANLGKP